MKGDRMLCVVVLRNWARDWGLCKARMLAALVKLGRTTWTRPYLQAFTVHVNPQRPFASKSKGAGFMCTECGAEAHKVRESFHCNCMLNFKFHAVERPVSCL